MITQVERSTPFWNSRPNSRTSSPAPARASPAAHQRASPAPVRASPAAQPRDSTAAGSRQTQQQQQQIPISVPIQSQQQQQNQATTPIRSQKTQQQQEVPINVPIKTVPQQQQHQGWGQKLAGDSAGAATNAADFTKNFLSQLATSTNATSTNGSSSSTTNGSNRGLAAPLPSNGVQPNQLHNPGPENNENLGAGRSVSAPRRGCF